MDVLGLRKIVLIGCRFDCPEGAPVLDRNGLPATMRKHPVILKIAFWIPCSAPHRRCDGRTEVINALPAEVQAMRDGAIIEHIQEFQFPEQPTLDQMRSVLMPVWEGLTVESLGFLPNRAPQDDKPKFAVQFTAVTE